MNKGTSEADGVKKSEQGHWTKRVSQRQKKDQAKGLEDVMAELRLESTFDRSAIEMIFSMETEFNAWSWIGVDWRDLLRPKKDETKAF
jgi:hypothetical protein